MHKIYREFPVLFFLIKWINNVYTNNNSLYGAIFIIHIRNTTSGVLKHEITRQFAHTIVQNNPAVWQPHALMQAFLPFLSLFHEKKIMYSRYGGSGCGMGVILLDMFFQPHSVACYSLLNQV